jgi:hypothetical protein
LQVEVFLDDGYPHIIRQLINNLPFDTENLGSPARGFSRPPADLIIGTEEAAGFANFCDTACEMILVTFI